MIRRRGFTLIEMMVAVAIVGVLAAMAYVISRKGLANARVTGSVHQLSGQVAQLRSLAMRDMVDYALIIADAPGGDARLCDESNPAGCATYYVLSGVPPGWTFVAPFNVAGSTNPLTGPFFVAQYVMPKGIALVDPGKVAWKVPAPFSAAIPKATPGGTFGILISAHGVVSGIDPVANNFAGLAMAWGSEEDQTTATVNTRVAMTGVLIAYPGGLVRVFQGG